MFKKTQVLNIGLIGCGYWGPNYIRVFNQLPHSEIKVVCDQDRNRLSYIKTLYPNIESQSDYLQLLNDSEIEAVIISTPAATHYKITRESLLHDKHVLVEKPLTLSVKEGEEVVRLSHERKKILMVGHIFEYNPSVNWMKNYIKNNELGKIYCFHFTRTGLGPIRRDVNSMWDLATHDLSILLYLLEREPKDVSARGEAYIQQGVEDVVFITLKFEDGIICHIHVSWLDPRKKREVTIVGSKKMIVFDDMNPVESIRIYDRGVIEEYVDDFGKFQLSLKVGDITIPTISGEEPLKAQCSHFLNCIREGKHPRSSGEVGLKVVRCLVAAHQSLKRDGAVVKIK